MNIPNDDYQKFLYYLKKYTKFSKRMSVVMEKYNNQRKLVKVYNDKYIKLKSNSKNIQLIKHTKEFLKIENEKLKTYKNELNYYDKKLKEYQLPFFKFVGEKLGYHGSY